MCKNYLGLRVVKLEVLLTIFIVFHRNIETYLPPDLLFNDAIGLC